MSEPNRTYPLAESCPDLKEVMRGVTENGISPDLLELLAEAIREDD